jgi:hypothetical protein
MRVLGYINIVTGIAFCIFAAPLALVISFVLIPSALVIGAVREVTELVSTYPRDVVNMLQYGLKISNTGLKRVRGEQSK